MDIQPHEKERCVRAGQMGGQYLDSLGKYDLRTLTKEEWALFVECICMEYSIPF